MKDEIKEILDRFNFVKKEPNKLSYYPEDLLTREEMWLLYDYITNLQEENERLKEIVENLTTMTVNGDRTQIKNTAQYKLDIYKSRNEKVIQYIDSLFNTIDYDDEEFITFETLENIQNLAKYGQLNGGDEE